MTVFEFKTWMAEYIKSEKFDSKLVMERLKSVHYCPKVNKYSITGNANIIGTTTYDKPIASYKAEFNYKIAI